MAFCKLCIKHHLGPAHLTLALLFGGVVARAVEKPRRAQFTREVLLMELLATEETDEPDDGALSGSEDEYSDS
ncbi:hypothetical protein B0H13DRAFT_1587428 [Mycena leptocephala]|nr:hypothetical protein B0H13DRAFT_1587428 [Mycena leptocephala]